MLLGEVDYVLAPKFQWEYFSNASAEMMKIYSPELRRSFRTVGESGCWQLLGAARLVEEANQSGHGRVLLEGEAIPGDIAAAARVLTPDMLEFMALAPDRSGGPTGRAGADGGT